MNRDDDNNNDISDDAERNINGPNRNDSLFPSPYPNSPQTFGHTRTLVHGDFFVAVVASKPAAATTATAAPIVPIKHRWTTLVFGHPFRGRLPDETSIEYQVERFSHYFVRWRRAIVGITVLLVTALLLCLARPTDERALSSELRPYSKETTAARALLNGSASFVVYAPPCVAPTGHMRQFNRSRDLCVSCMRANPYADDSRDYALFMRHAATLLAVNSESMLPCVCAPLVGVPINAILCRFGSMINARTATTGVNRVVRHTQAAHFNVPDSFARTLNGTSDVLLLRSSAITIEYDSTYNTQLRNFVGAEAYSVQECLDLIEGRSIWTEALRQHEQYPQYAPTNDEIKQYAC